MDAKFYERNSGTRLVEETFRGAVRLAEGFQVVLNEHVRFHLVNERLKELQPQLDAQSEKLEGLRKKLEKAEKQKKPRNQVKAIREEYRIESQALDELARCVNVLHSVNKPPVIPEWLTGFLKDVVNGNDRKR